MAILNSSRLRFKEERNVHRHSRMSAALLIRWAVLFVALALIVGPLLLMVMTSFKTQGEIFASPIRWPESLSWENYIRAWEVGGVPSKALNSVIVTVGAVSLATFAGAGVGYVAARARKKWVGNLIVGFFALGLILPIQTALVPLFVEMQFLGLLGTLWPIILVGAALQLPLIVVIFSAFFAALPIEIEEAAFVDGAGRFRVLWSVVLPLARPATATAVILATVTVWNDFFTALVFAVDPSLQTLPVGLSAFKGLYATDWGGSLAYSGMVALPLILVYIALQRYILDGVTAGAVRG